MTFSEFVRLKGIYISTHNRDTDVYEDYNVDELLQEYNQFLEENKPITAEFLSQEDFFLYSRDDGSIYYTRFGKSIDILIEDVYWYLIYKGSVKIQIPTPPTQKDVLDLIKLLDINK